MLGRSFFFAVVTIVTQAYAWNCAVGSGTAGSSTWNNVAQNVTVCATGSDSCLYMRQSDGNISTTCQDSTQMFDIDATYTNGCAMASGMKFKVTR